MLLSLSTPRFLKHFSFGNPFKDSNSSSSRTSPATARKARRSSKLSAIAGALSPTAVATSAQRWTRRGSSTTPLETRTRSAAAKGKERADFDRNPITGRYAGPGSEDDSSDEEFESPPPPELQKGALYSAPPFLLPQGKWAITEDQPMTVLKRGPTIASGHCCHVTFCYGIPAGWDKPVLYISKVWRGGDKTEEGFYTELGMYKGIAYLLSAQGSLVPRLAGLTSSPHGISMAMELIDDRFWFEAHSSLPEVMKHRIIQTFAQLHARGIVHGSPELRHILITSRCEVKLIDFKRSDALIKDKDLGIDQCSKHDFIPEMRLLKYKLDFRGARAAEHAKIQRVYELGLKNMERARLHKEKEDGTYDGPLEPLEPCCLEDLVEPPPDPETLEKIWQSDFNRIPRTVWVPGLSERQTQVAWLQYQQILANLDAEYRSRGFPCERSNRFAWMAPQPHPMYGSPEPLTGSKKRRAAASGHEDEPIPKRARLDGATSSDSELESEITKSTVDEIMLNPICDVHINPLLALLNYPPLPEPEHVFLDGKRPSTPSDIPPSYERYSQSYDCKSGALLRAGIRKASGQRAASAAPVARDFMDVPCKLRGYYVPHPPTENRIGINRAWYIRQLNSLECRRLQYPYFVGDMFDIKQPHFHRSVARGQSINKGTLKRKSLDPDGIDDAGAVKRRRLLDGTAGAADEEIEYVISEETLQLRGPTDRKRDVTSRSILKDVPRTWRIASDTDEDAASDSDLLHSPKIGPRFLSLTPLDRMPVLGGVQDDRNILARVGQARALTALEDAFLDALVHGDATPPPHPEHYCDPPPSSDGPLRPGEAVRRKRLEQLSGLVNAMAKRHGLSGNQLCGRLERLGSRRRPPGLLGPVHPSTEIINTSAEPSSEADTLFEGRKDSVIVIDLTNEDSPEPESEDEVDAAAVEAILFCEDEEENSARPAVGGPASFTVSNIIKYFY